jgi:hypothetical protein
LEGGEQAGTRHAASDTSEAPDDVGSNDTCRESGTEGDVAGPFALFLGSFSSLLFLVSTVAVHPGCAEACASEAEGGTEGGVKPLPATFGHRSFCGRSSSSGRSTSASGLRSGFRFSSVSWVDLNTPRRATTSRSSLTCLTPCSGFGGSGCCSRTWSSLGSTPGTCRSQLTIELSDGTVCRGASSGLSSLSRLALPFFEHALPELVRFSACFAATDCLCFLTKSPCCTSTCGETFEQELSCACSERFFGQHSVGLFEEVLVAA